MISKPLFKQSCKANAGIWTFVTGVTCFMLAIIILVLGNLNVNGIRSSMTDMFVSDAIEAEVEKSSMTYFNMTSKALESYEENCDSLRYLLNVQLDSSTKDYMINTYETLKSNGLSDEEIKVQMTNGADENTAKATTTFIDYYIACGRDYSDNKISMYVLNNVADNIYNQLINESGEETANNAKLFIGQAVNSYNEYKVVNLSSNAVEFATNYIPNVLSGVFYDAEFDYEGRTISIKSYFNKEDLNNKSYTSIVSFRARMDIKDKQLREENPTFNDAQISSALSDYSSSLIAEMSRTLIDEFPDKVVDALTEIRGLDVYGLVIGSIFFRIAGLLLPMIFVIMTANNLIAGQVDSGSMAYVLSTPTKRRTVTLTQMLYMITSLFVMFALTTLTSIVCLAIVSSSEITINYGEIVLLNLGAFITMFAISGICFLSSCWFNRSKMSMSCGGGLTMFFLVATILGLFGSKVIPSAIRIDAMKYFNYVSIISLFDAISILEGTLTFLWKFAILIAIGVITYTISILKFNKKDLPL